MSTTNSYSANAEVVTTPAAERMRLHRQRRREGLTCLWIQLRETEIEQLVLRGMLSPADHSDKGAIEKSLYRLLDQWLAQE